MATTVAVKDDTFAMLKEIKEQEEVANFDEVIKKLLIEMKKPKRSYLGMFPSLGKFKREDVDRFD
jgi:predicted CopG family antitoxin